MAQRSKPAESVWQDFQKTEHLSDRQLEQFKDYEALLSLWNKDINLTAITDLTAIVRLHFQDSLAMSKMIDLQSLSSILDIGTGAGFPALPLKIIYPHLRIFLLEVTKKRQKFLLEVVSKLGLTDIEIVDCDWRTFLRTMEIPVDCFVTRASLPDVELIRMFKPSCKYRTAPLIYWAAEEWVPHKKVEPYLASEVPYVVGRKNRRLIMLKSNDVSEGS